MFVLAHLSDPHLGPLPFASPRQLAGKRAIGFINWRRHRRGIHRPETLQRIVADLKAQQPDHIAVTGDLVNIALPDEFAPARLFLETLGSPSDVTLVPGNHDFYVRGAAEFPAQHWGAYMSGDGNEKFPFLRRRGPVALIGLSTAVPTRPFMATGLLGSEQLRGLAGMLDGLGPDVFKVVLIHHPPVSASARHKRLIDAAAFRDAIARHGCDLVLHGHDHTHSLVWLDGKDRKVPVLGVPSASADEHARDGPAGYNLYRITGEPGAFRCEAIYRGIRGETIIEIGRAPLQ